MNRIQFMTELAALLQDISVEERVEAMKYYNDYFDEAGEEKEEDIIRELGSPVKVAAEVKAGLGEASPSAGEYRETGYTDTRFEHRDIPAYPGQEKETDNREQNMGAWGQKREEKSVGKEETPQQKMYQSGNAMRDSGKKNTGVKIMLIILVVLVGAPVILPIALALFCIAAAIFISVVAVFIALAVASVMVALLGVVFVGAGIASLLPEVSAGLVLIGGGLITFVIGLIMTVASVRACIIVLPGFFRGTVYIVRKPFHRRKAVA